jgi:predicted nuclease of restriction endonuclease-like (RecB) superfamily
LPALHLCQCHDGVNLMKSPLSPVAGKQKESYPQLIEAISSIHSRMVGHVASAANRALVLRNWMVGAHIVGFEQNGSGRAGYGEKLLERLADDLAAGGVRGMGAIVLGRCRQLFLVYPQIGTQIPSPLGMEFVPSEISSPAGTKSGKGGQTADGEKTPVPLSSEQLARISWAHFLELVRIADPWKRAFYENELLRGQWSKRQLQRQISSLLYERTGLSTDREGLVERGRNQEPRETVADLLRDPYVLEFTGLAELPQYSEEHLESALLDHLQRFLLELGRGFCFEARQFRMTEGRRHHRVDLVFYHRLLRCHVLIDLKIRSFEPGDAGQMNFYLNWFKGNMMVEGDNPPVGILLCSGRDGAEVEYATAGMDQQLFVSRYLTALPSPEQLRQFLERDQAEIEALIHTGDKE